MRTEGFGQSPVPFRPGLDERRACTGSDLLDCLGIALRASARPDDVSLHAQAQWFNGPAGERTHDPHWVDEDNNGRAWEDI